MNVEDFDFSVNLLESLLWQYNKATNLTALLQSKQDWYEANVTQFIENWIRDVFDLRTANLFGLSVWSKILDFPLHVYLAASSSKFGFGAYRKNFNRGNFSSADGTIADLPIEEQRIALQLRYLKLTFRPTTTNINKILKWVFAPYGNAWVIDNLDMTMTYVFDFAPSSTLNIFLTEYDLLPRPAGVAVNYMTVNYPTFGFGPANKNFNRGVFRT